MWVSICFFKSLSCMNSFSQIWQTWFLSSLWIKRTVFLRSVCEYIFLWRSSFLKIYIFFKFIVDTSVVRATSLLTQNIVNILNISFIAIHYNIQMENRQSKENISKCEKIYCTEVLKLNDKTLKLKRGIIIFQKEYLI